MAGLKLRGGEAVLSDATHLASNYTSAERAQTYSWQCPAFGMPWDVAHESIVRSAFSM